MALLFILAMRLWLAVVLWILTLIAGGSAFLYLAFPVETVFHYLGGWIYWLYYDEITDSTNLPLLEYDKILFREHSLAFYMHVTFGPIALIAGLLQFNGRLRKSKPHIHRWVGRVYLIAQFLGLPGGMILGMHEFAGLVAMYGFIGMGGSTLICSAIGYYKITQGLVDEHREWMIRSYAIMWSSVVLFRISIMYWIPLEVRRIGGTIPDDFRDPYIVCIFLSWSLALLAADIYLAFSKPSKSKSKSI